MTVYSDGVTLGIGLQGPCMEVGGVGETATSTEKVERIERRS